MTTPAQAKSDLVHELRQLRARVRERKARFLQFWRELRREHEADGGDLARAERAFARACDPDGVVGRQVFGERSGWSPPEMARLSLQDLEDMELFGHDDITDPLEDVERFLQEARDHYEV